ncbi:MAG: DNA polymerase III subunit delta [Candidatus Caldatribacteriaceae bacterium]
MAKETFRVWWQEQTAARFFLFELKIGRKFFEEWYLPFVEEKLVVKRVVNIESEEEWKEKSSLVLEPSLFPEAILFLLWGIGEKTAREIKEKFSMAPFFFLFLPRKVEERRWKDIPWVVVEMDERTFRKFWSSRAQQFNVSLSRMAEQRLFHFLSTCDLGKSDLEYFFAFFAGRNDISGEDVEFFFEREEKVLLFRFLDALGRRDMAKAFHYLQGLWNIDFAPSRLIAQVARRFRLLLQVYEGEKGTHDAWQGKELHPFEAEKVRVMREKYSLSEVYQAFTLLRTADRLMKTQGSDPRIVLARVVEAIMIPQGPGSTVEQGAI